MGSGGGVSLDPVSAAIGTVGDVVSGFVNRKGQEEADDRNWRHTVQMWNMNNEYNSPVNQMKRYEEAGLNPNLLFSQVSAGNATQPSVPQSGAARFSLDLSRYLRKQDKMTDEEIERQGLENEILKLRKEALEHDVAISKFHNIPTKSPWYATYLLNFLDKARGKGFNVFTNLGAILDYLADGEKRERRAHDEIYDDEFPDSSFHSGEVRIIRR